MIETGPVRKRFLGNPEIAVRYIHRARVLLGMLKETMRFGNMPAGLRTYTYPVDEIVDADILIARDLIETGGTRTDIETNRQYRLRAGHVVIRVSSAYGLDEILVDASRVESLEDLLKATVTPTEKEEAAAGYLRVRILSSLGQRDVNFLGFNLYAFEPKEVASFWTDFPAGSESGDGIPPDKVEVGSITFSEGPSAGILQTIYIHVSKHGMYGGNDGLRFSAAVLEPNGSERFKENIHSVSSAQSDDYEWGQLAVVDPLGSVTPEGEEPRIGQVRPGNYVFKTSMTTTAYEGVSVSGTLEIDCGNPIAPTRHLIEFTCGPFDSENEYGDGSYSTQYWLVNPAAGTVETKDGETTDLGID